MRIALAAVLVLLVGTTGLARGAGDERTAAEVSVMVSVSGGGRVASEPPGAIDCGSRCAAEVELGTTLTLRATPDGGRALTGWDGACGGRGLACTFVVEEATSVAATFGPAADLPPPTSLDVTRSAGGEVVSDPPGVIACGTDCAAAWRGGGNVTLRARAFDGFRFLGWFDDCSGSDDACRLTLDAGRDATAVFVRNPLPPGTFDLVVRNQDPPGSGDPTGTLEVVISGLTTPCDDPVCTFPDLAFGTNVLVRRGSGTLRAWEGACVGTAEECRLVVSGDAEVVASFREDGPAPSFGVTVSRSRGGEVSSVPPGIACGPNMTCAAAFGSTTRVELRQRADPGFEFRGWGGDCAGAAACAVRADATRFVSARFARPTNQLRVELAGRGRGTVRSRPPGIECPPTCAAPFPAGTTVSLDAARRAGSAFARWDGACGTAATCTVTLAGDRTVSARFDRCAAADFRGFVIRLSQGRRQLQVRLVLTGRASVRAAVLRGRATVKARRTGILAPGTRSVALVVPRTARGAHTVRVTVADACGASQARSRRVVLR
jgi:hypothetical protein